MSIQILENGIKGEKVDPMFLLITMPTVTTTAGK